MLCQPAPWIEGAHVRQHHLPSSRHSKARPCAAYGNHPGNRPIPSFALAESTMLRQPRQNKAPRLAAQAALSQLTLPQTRQMPRQMKKREPGIGLQQRRRARNNQAVQRQTRANRQTSSANKAPSQSANAAEPANQASSTKADTVSATLKISVYDI